MGSKKCSYDIVQDFWPLLFIAYMNIIIITITWHIKNLCWKVLCKFGRHSVIVYMDLEPSCCHHSTRHFTGHPPSWLLWWSHLQGKVTRQHRDVGKDACYCDWEMGRPVLVWMLRQSHHESSCSLSTILWSRELPVENTIEWAKAANPNLSAVFYLNTLYDFPFLELHGKCWYNRCEWKVSCLQEWQWNAQH